MAQSQQFEDVPYVILAVAPFAPSGSQGSSALRRVRVDLTSLDEAFETLAPTLRVGVPTQFCPEAWVTLSPRSMRDFRPERLVAVCPYLAQLDKGRSLLQEARGSGQTPEQVAEALRAACPDAPLDYSALQDSAPGGASSAAASDVDDILSMVATSGGSSPGGGKGVAGMLAQMDGLMAGVLQAVFDDPGFRAFESAWRGAKLVLEQAGVREGQGIKVELAPLDTSDNGWMDALEASISELAGELPNLVLVDAMLDSAPQRIENARRLASFADTLLTPTIVGVGPEFFRLQSWSELSKVPYIKNFLEDAGFAKWRNLRGEAGAGWLAVALNGVLARPRHGEDAPPRTAFFAESAPLWLNPAWAVAASAAKSVSVHGWPSRLTDYHSVLLDNLPVAKPGEGEGAMATQMRLGEDRMAEFAEAGFTSVVGAVHKDVAMTPHAVTLSGGPLAAQLFLNRVLGFLFWCKDNLAGEIDSDGGADVAGNLQAAFSLFWRRTGHEAPLDLKITAGEPQEGLVPLQIRFTPLKDVLPVGAPIEFTFAW